MNKRFSTYLIAWALLLALFNIIVFVAPGWAGLEKYTFSFWLGYALISLTFVLQLGCTYEALRSGDNKKLFYRIPLISISYTSLIVSMIVGGLCMLISSLTYWIGITACATLAFFYALSITKASAAIAEVEGVERRVKDQTLFIKSLTVEADTLTAMAKSDATRASCTKVLEALRYSDPMSHASLAGVEGQISTVFASLSAAVRADDAVQAASLADELTVLIKDRNNKCILLK